MSDGESIFFNYFRIIKDTRQQRKIRHLLIDILFIAVAATIANASDWEEVEIFAKKREEWFRKFLNSQMEYHLTIHLIKVMVVLKQENTI